LVTDYLSGGDLQSLLNEHQKLPASLALEIAEQLCDALAYLHERSCVHCDVKPRNILFHERPAGYGLTEATRPILIDFGIAKNPTEGPQLASGTPRWITPELYQALRIGRKIEVDPTWDSYAAGLVLYTMVTGRKPELDNPGSQSWKPLSPSDLGGDPTVRDAKQLADGLNRLIAGATADRIEQRTTAATLANGVRTLKQHVRKPGVATAPVSQPRRSSKGLWLALAGGAAALLLAAVLFLADVLPTGSGQNDGGATSAAVERTTSTPIEVVVLPPPTATHTPTTKPPPRPTSTPLNTPTFTPPPTVTATRTPTPTIAPTKPAATPTNTPKQLTPTSTVALTPTPAQNNANVAPPTSTKVPTPTSTALPSPTRTPVTTAATTAVTTAVTTSAASAANQTSAGEMSATLIEPDNHANIDFNSQMTFAWQPSRTLKGNECFELVFWQGASTNWQNGWGIWSANRDTTVRRIFNADYETGSTWLKPGSTYSWGVVLIEDCSAYQNRQPSPRRLISDVRTITYRK